MRREVVDFSSSDRLIVDVSVCVIAEPFGLIDKFTCRNVQLLFIEHRAIDKFDLLVLANLPHGFEIAIAV